MSDHKPLKTDDSTPKKVSVDHNTDLSDLTPRKRVPTYQTDDVGDNIFVRLFAFIASVCFSIGRTTTRYIKNIPHRVVGYFQRKQFEYNRMPKRKSPNRIYQLVGYTTKSYVSRKIRREKFFSFTRSILLFAIIVVLIIMFINNVAPYLDPKKYEQIFGISDIDQLTDKDPFTQDDDTGIQVFTTERETIPIDYVETREQLPDMSAEQTD